MGVNHVIIHTGPDKRIIKQKMIIINTSENLRQKAPQ